MRMTRDAYAREVWKVVEAFHQGQKIIPCPHENCDKQLEISQPSLKTGTALICSKHGIIFRE